MKPELHQSSTDDSAEIVLPNSANFVGVLQDPLRAKFFRDFLKTQNADNCYAFVSGVDHFRNEPDVERRRKRGETLMRTFIEEEGDEQVFVGAEEVIRIRAALKEPECDPKAFDGAQAQVMSELQIDKFSAFCNSMFCVMMRRAIQSRQLVMNESAVDAFVDYCVTEDTRHWSKHVERDDDLEYWVSRIPERKGIFLRARIKSAPFSADRVSEILFDCEEHMPKYDPICVKALPIQKFDENFKILQTWHKQLRMFEKKELVGVIAMVRHKTEEGNHLILYRTVAWPEELLHPCKGLPRSGLDVSGYYVEPLGPEECRITKILQLHVEEPMGPLQFNKQIKSRGDHLKLLTEYMKTLPQNMGQPQAGQFAI